jgi:hypothetical protein
MKRKNGYINQLTRQGKGDEDYHNLIRYNREDDYFGATGGVDTLPDTSKHYTFTVKNSNPSSGSDVTAWLFGAMYSVGNSQNAAIDISVAESSHAEIQESIRANGGFRIVGLKYIVSNSDSQFDKALNIKTKTDRGNENTTPVQPRIWSSNMQYKSKELDALNFSIWVDLYTRIEFTVEAGETCTMIFHIAERLERANPLRGKPERQVAQNLMQTGVSTVDSVAMRS